MPVKRKQDSQGPYYQWGNHGKKYRFIPNNNTSRKIAKDRATKQGEAAYANGYKG